MHIISRKKLREFCRKHPNAEANLQTWYKITSKANWKNFAELRQSFPSADLVENFILFNISGNSYIAISNDM